MAQVRKPHVQDGFVVAAAAAFAELGYEATTMGVVAERAGSSIGNLYKYFSGKDELFAAAVPAELVRELRQRTRARIRALGTARDVRELPGESPYHVLAGDLLDYCLRHRHGVVIVLARAEGTPYAGFAGHFVSELVGWALQYAEHAYPSLEPSPELRFVLTRAYEAFLSNVAAALLRFADEQRVRRVIAQLTSHHQGGLKRLFETEGGSDAQPRHVPEPPVVTEAPGTPAGYARSGAARSGSAGSGTRQADRARRPRRRG